MKAFRVLVIILSVLGALALLLLPLCLLAGCTSPRPARVVRHAEAHEFTKPDVRPVAVHIHDAAQGAARAQTEVAAAQAATSAAQASARRIVEAGVVAHSAEADVLAAQITKTQAALFRAQTELRDTADKLAAAAQQVAVLDAKVTAQATQLFNTEAARVTAVNHAADLSGQLVTEQESHRADNTAKDAATAHQTRLAWKWRIAFFGLLALLAAFFVARQYLPFLKFI